MFIEIKKNGLKLSHFIYNVLLIIKSKRCFSWVRACHVDTSPAPFLCEPGRSPAEPRGLTVPLLVCLTSSPPSAIVSFRLWFLDSSHTRVSWLMISLSYFRYTLSTDFLPSLTCDRNRFRFFRILSEKYYVRGNFVTYSFLGFLNNFTFYLKSKIRGRRSHDFSGALFPIRCVRSRLDTLALSLFPKIPVKVASLREFVDSISDLSTTLTIKLFWWLRFLDRESCSWAIKFGHFSW